MKINRDSLQFFSKQNYLEYIKLFPVLNNKKAKDYSMIITTFLTMIFFAIFAINPTITTIIELHKTLKDAQFANQQLTNKIESLKILQNKFQTMGSDYELILSSIPTKPRSAYFLGQIQSIAANTGTKLQNLSLNDILLSSSTPSQEANSFVFSLSVSGNYDQISNFLSTFSSFNRIITFSSLNITKTSINEKNINLTIQGKAYYLN